MLSTIYVTLYLAMGLPAVIAGYLVVHGGLLTTARRVRRRVMLLALLALGGLVAQRPRRARRAQCATCPAAT